MLVAGLEHGDLVDPARHPVRHLRARTDARPRSGYPCSWSIEIVFAAGIALAISSIDHPDPRPGAGAAAHHLARDLFATPVIWPFSKIPTDYHVGGGRRAPRGGGQRARGARAHWVGGITINLQIVYGFFNPLGPVIDNARRTMLLGQSPDWPSGGSPRSARSSISSSATGSSNDSRCTLPTLPDGTIEVEHVWKRFRADRTVPKFYDQMKRFGKSIGKRGRHEYRWVLKDVNFEVEPGGTLALIGINGSGKTTLLKIISQVTYQTAGRCDGRRPDRGTAQRDQRDPARADRPRERLPLRCGARDEPADDPAALRRDRRVRRARPTRSIARSSSTRWACRCGSASRSPPSSSPTSSWSTRCSPSATPTSSRSACKRIGEVVRQRHHPDLRLPRPRLGRGVLRAGGLAGRRGRAGRRARPRRWSTKYRAAVEQNAALDHLQRGRGPGPEGRHQRRRRRPGPLGGRPRGPSHPQLAGGLRRQLLHRGVAGHRLPDVHRPLQRLVPGRRLRGPVRAPPPPARPRAATRCGRRCPDTCGERASRCCPGDR